MTGARPCPGPHGRGEPPITAEPMCRHCVAELVSTIERLPEQYIAAYLALEPGQRTHEDGGRARGKGAEAPLPLDVEADALMRRILEVVLSWWDAVVPAAKLSWATVPSDGVAISTACRTLAVHVDTLLRIDGWPMTRAIERRRVLGKPELVFVGAVASPPVQIMRGRPLLPDDTIGEVRSDGHATIVLVMSGVQGALELLELRRDAERTLGHSRRSTQLERPCPSCEEPELHLTEGQDHVRCWACGERWDASDYPRLAAVLAVGEAS